MLWAFFHRAREKDESSYRGKGERRGREGKRLLVGALMQSALCSSGAYGGWPAALTKKYKIGRDTEAEFAHRRSARLG
jgi:hypothetical protein